jgi:hypothetical protein
MSKFIEKSDGSYHFEVTFQEVEKKCAINVEMLNDPTFSIIGNMKPTT